MLSSSSNICGQMWNTLTCQVCSILGYYSASQVLPVSKGNESLMSFPALSVTLCHTPWCLIRLCLRHIKLSIISIANTSASDNHSICSTQNRKERNEVPKRSRSKNCSCSHQTVVQGTISWDSLKPKLKCQTQSVTNKFFYSNMLR